MIQFPIQLHGLPIQLVLLQNGQVGFVKIAQFLTIYDWNNQVVIDEQFLLVKNEKFLYNKPYNLTDSLKEYLLYLELENPFVEYQEQEFE